MTRRKNDRTSARLELSKPAVAALAAVKDELESRPAWMHAVSNSVAIEFLAWNFLHCGPGQGMTDFKPLTRLGRPTLDRQSLQETMRPSRLRKATGAPSAQLGLPSTGNALDKPPGRR